MNGNTALGLQIVSNTLLGSFSDDNEFWCIVTKNKYRISFSIFFLLHIRQTPYQNLQLQYSHLILEK